MVVNRRFLRVVTQTFLLSSRLRPDLLPPQRPPTSVEDPLGPRHVDLNTLDEVPPFHPNDLSPVLEMSPLWTRSTESSLRLSSVSSLMTSLFVGMSTEVRIETTDKVTSTVPRHEVCQDLSLGVLLTPG